MEAIHDMVIQDRQIMQRIKSLGYPDVDNISPLRLFGVAITELYKEAKNFHNVLHSQLFGPKDVSHI